VEAVHRHLPLEACDLFNIWQQAMKIRREIFQEEDYLKNIVRADSVRPTVGEMVARWPDFFRFIQNWGSSVPPDPWR
jgi:hypothetical protein